ncbi:hypothetical protein Scel_11280 [Streptomyces cellostaticus]|nr:hypothetical protein Scel_11280 [Streptomyces cellostaticus]
MRQKQAPVTTRTRTLHTCLRRRNTRARHADVLAARRRERVRSEKRISWGRTPSRRGSLTKPVNLCGQTTASQPTT